MSRSNRPLISTCAYCSLWSMSCVISSAVRSESLRMSMVLGVGGGVRVSLDFVVNDRLACDFNFFNADGGV